MPGSLGSDAAGGAAAGAAAGAALLEACDAISAASLSSADARFACCCLATFAGAKDDVAGAAVAGLALSAGVAPPTTPD